MALTMFVKNTLLISIDKELDGHKLVTQEDECYVTAALLKKLQQFGLTKKEAVTTNELKEIRKQLSAM